MRVLAARFEAGCLLVGYSPPSAAITECLVDGTVGGLRVGEEGSRERFLRYRTEGSDGPRSGGRTSWSRRIRLGSISSGSCGRRPTGGAWPIASGRAFSQDCGALADGRRCWTCSASI